MALISVAELLFDPDFVDPVTLVRRHTVVDQSGNAVVTEERIGILASIQAASGDVMTPSPDATRIDGSYEIITTFPITAASETTEADIVEWRGARFTVESVPRFGNFAGVNGHYEGVMSFKSLLPPVGPP